MRYPKMLRSTIPRAPMLLLSLLLGCGKSPTEPNLVVNQPAQGPLAGQWTGTVRAAGVESSVTATVTEIEDRIGVELDTTAYAGAAVFSGTLDGKDLEGDLELGLTGIFGCPAMHGPASGSASPKQIHLEVAAIPSRQSSSTHIECRGAPRSTIELSR